MMPERKQASSRRAASGISVEGNELGTSMTPMPLRRFLETGVDQTAPVSPESADLLMLRNHLSKCWGVWHKPLQVSEVQERSPGLCHRALSSTLLNSK